MTQASVGCLCNNVEKWFPTSTDNVLNILSESYSVPQFPAPIPPNPPQICGERGFSKANIWWNFQRDDH